MAAPSLNKIERAHQMYRDGWYAEALGFYTEALAMAKTKPQKIALHSNRAACYLKLQDFKKAAEECTSVLELDHKHAGALMLRAQTLVTLKEYQSALFDVNRLMELNPSSDVYQNLQARLKTQLSLAPIPESEEEALAAELDEEEGEASLATELDVGRGEMKAASLAAELDEGRGEMKAAELDEGRGEMKSVVVLEANENQETNHSRTNPVASTTQPECLKEQSDLHSKGWEAIPKPKGHSRLDYSRWDGVEDDSSEEEDLKPQYRFRVKTVGVRAVK